MLSVAFGSLTRAAVVELGFGLGCLACSFVLVRALPPGLITACSPWLLGLWPELLWFSWASVWVALHVRSFVLVRALLPGLSPACSPWLLGL